MIDFHTLLLELLGSVSCSLLLEFTAALGTQCFLFWGKLW